MSTSEITMLVLIVILYGVTLAQTIVIQGMRQKMNDSPALHFVKSQDPAPKPPLESTTKVAPVRSDEHPVLRRTQLRGKPRRRF